MPPVRTPKAKAAGPYTSSKKAAKKEGKKTAKKMTGKVTEAIKNSSQVEKADRVAVFGSKRVLIKKQKKFTVSKQFKNLVNAALSEKMVKGTQVYRFVDMWHPLRNVANDSQYVLPLSGTGEGYDGGWHFTLDYFLDAAQKLFLGDATTSAGFLRPTKIPSWNTLKFQVVNSFSQYVIRNTSLRTIYFKIVELAPKSAGTMNITQPSQEQGYDSTGTVRTVPDATVSGLYAWSKANLADWNDGFSANNNTGPIIPQALGVHPNQSKNMNKNWSMKTFEYVIAPGAQIVFKVQGPNNFEVDMQKMFKNDIFQNVQKYSRSLIGITVLDLVGMDLGGTQRAPMTNTLPGGGANVNYLTDNLAIERYDHIKIEMPESMTMPDHRRDRYNICYLGAGQELGSNNYDVHEDNPVQKVVDG